MILCASYVTKGFREDVKVDKQEEIVDLTPGKSYRIAYVSNGAPVYTPWTCIKKIGHMKYMMQSEKSFGESCYPGRYYNNVGYIDAIRINLYPNLALYKQFSKIESSEGYGFYLLGRNEYTSMHINAMRKEREYGFVWTGTASGGTMAEIIELDQSDLTMTMSVDRKAYIFPTFNLDMSLAKFVSPNIINIP